MYHKHSPHFTVETNDAQQLVAAAAGNIEKLLAKRSEALKVSVSSQSARGGGGFIFSLFLSKFEIQMEIRSSERARGGGASLGPLADGIRADILQPADLM